MSNFITDEQVEKALNFIRDSAEEIGRLRGLIKFLEHNRKIVRSQLILDSDMKTFGLKEADAEAHEDYRAAVKDIQDAETEYGTIMTLFTGAQAKIDVWRSLNARNRAGHL